LGNTQKHPAAKPEKILVILLSEMGSLVLAHPMFELLKNKYPNSSIHALVFKQNSIVIELMDVMPKENIHTVSNRSLSALLTGSLRLISKMRNLKIDTVIDCELFSRISSIYSFLSGARIRAGFHPHTQEGLYRGDFINRPVLYNPYIHISQQFITLVEALESNQTPTVKRRINTERLHLPPVKFDSDEIKNLQTKFKSDFSLVSEKKLILIYPGGGLLPIRAWPLENYFRLADTLIQKGYAVAIIGMQSDKELANKILSHCNSEYCIDLTGYTETVRELMIIFHFAALLITNDGGPVHFAAMTPIPTITFYGPETPELYSPLNPRAFNFYLPLSCSPCLTAYNHRKSSCNGDNICLKNINPKDVLEKTFEILQG
jgi:lipopolysaccharide heptosyltransferase II